MVDFNLLSACRLFSCLDMAVLHRVAKEAKAVHIAPDEVLFSRGDEADAAYIVTRGAMAIEVMSVDGRALRLATLHRGELFGELALVDGGTRTADARSQETTELIRLEKADFQRLAQEEAGFAHALTVSVVNRLRATNNHVESVVWQTIRSRLAALLLSLAGDGDQIKITQFELADRLSVTREKVNTRLSELQKAGAIETGRGSILVKDASVLALIAGLGGESKPTG